jgi:hypothetical protein
MRARAVITNSWGSQVAAHITAPRLSDIKLRNLMGIEGLGEVVR